MIIIIYYYEIIVMFEPRALQLLPSEYASKSKICALFFPKNGSVTVNNISNSQTTIAHHIQALFPEEKYFTFIDTYWLTKRFRVYNIFYLRLYKKPIIRGK
jgi:hypothetical protein